MTDEHYESLRRHILDLRVEIEALKLLVKQLLKARSEPRSLDGVDYLDTIEQIKVPDDLKRFFPD